MFRFLIVDDSETDAVLLSHLVEMKYGRIAECSLASDMKTALEYLDERRHKPVDAVLLDLNLTDSQGIETFRALHAAVGGRVPIVVNTGRDDERGMRDQLIAEGAAAYLPKGQVEAEQVFETLRDAAQAARFSARLRPDAARAIQRAEQAGNALVKSASRGGNDAPTSELLFAESMDANGRLLADVVREVAIIAESQRSILWRMSRMESDLVRNQSATDTLRTEAQKQHKKIGSEITRLRDVDKKTKLRLSSLALAVLSLGWAMGKGPQWFIELLLQLGGFTP